MAKTGLTRRDARMIAEELYRLQKEDMGFVPTDMLTRKEAAAVLKVHPSYLAHNKDKYPCEIIHGKAMYSHRGIMAIAQGRAAV